MKNNREKKKLVSLEEASKIFGYSKDYIMYLAKKKEIEIIKKDSSCFVGLESLSEYRKNKDERFKKETSKDWRKKRTVKSFIHDVIPPIQKDIDDIKENIAEKVKLVEKKVSIWAKALYLFLKTSKYGSIVLVLGVALLGGTIIWGFSPKIEVAEIYPAQYEGDWQNIEKALERDLPEDADLPDFNFENSASLFLSVKQEKEEIIPPPEGGSEEEGKIDQPESIEDSEEEVQVGDAEPAAGDIEPTVKNTEPAEETSEEEEEEAGADQSEPTGDAEERVQAGDAEPVAGNIEPADAQDVEDSEDEEEEKFEDLTTIIPDIIVTPNVDGELPGVFGIEQISPAESDDSETIFTNSSVATYSGFKMPGQQKQIKKIKAGFSLASPKSDNANDELLVEYSMDGENWSTALELRQDKIYSNKNNGGYFYADIFNEENQTIDSKDIENIKIKFTILSNSPTEENQTLLDAVWLETESEKLDEEIDKEQRIEILSSKKDFKMGEDPEFKFKYEKEEKGFLVSIGETLGVIDYWDDINLTAEIIGPDGEVFGIPGEEFGNFNEIFTLEKSGEIIVKLKENKKFKPGLYKIILKIEENGDIQVLEQDFTWGVLAINVNKSIYLPGEEAYLQMGVLRNDGHTICDARLELRIKNSESSELGIETLLSTEDGTIQYSGQCSGNNVTDVPDYFAYYQVGDVGTYEMTLTNLDNGYEIIDSFEVRESVLFDVERIGPSRIYPPADYEMVLKIKANEDFEGEIAESVPEGFVITNQEVRIWNLESGEFEIYNSNLIIQEQEDKSQSLIFQDINLKKDDELEIKYTFDAPDISPHVYLLGPLNFSEEKSFTGKAIENISGIIQSVIGEVNPFDDENIVSKNIIFEEIRQWQIASDADTGVKYPTVVSSAYGYPYDDNDWVNTEEIKTANDVYASITAQTFDNLDYSYILRATDFDFAIPEDVVIFGIVVEMERHCDSGETGKDVMFQLTKNGTDRKGENKATDADWPLTDTIYSYGDSTDLWDTTWTADEINASTFGVHLAVQATTDNAEIYVDFIRITVYYFVPNITGTVYLAGGTTPATAANGGPCDGTTSIVKAVVNAGTPSTAVICSAYDATFTVFTDSTPEVGDTITVYLTSADKANLVYTSDGTTDTGMNLYLDTVAVSHLNGTSIDILDIVDYDSTINNTDMLYNAVDATPDILTLESGIELHIVEGKTFLPGGTVTTTGAGGDLHLDYNSVTGAAADFETYAVTISGNVIIDANTTLTAPSTGAFNVAGSWINDGTFVSNSGTVTFNGAGSSTQCVGGNTAFNNFTATPSTARTILFAPDSTQTVSGTWNIAGDSEILTLDEASVPDKVTGLEASDGGNEIILEWDAATDNGCPITSYKVQRSSPTNTSYSLLETGGCSSLGSVLTCTDTGLTYDTLYYYKVSAVNAAGEGPESDEASATPFCTIVIGNQEWMCDNMNVGTRITSCVNGYVGVCTTGGSTVHEQNNDNIMEKYCHSDLEANCTTDGGLYQWAEALQLPYSCNTGFCEPSTPRRGICLSGYHIPTEAEFTTLSEYLSANSEYWCEGESDQIAKSLASTTALWYVSDNDCAVGNIPADNNDSGFAIIPASYRNSSGSFLARGVYGRFWTASSGSSEYSPCWQMSYAFSTMTMSSGFLNLVGISVRCVKD